MHCPRSAGNILGCRRNCRSQLRLRHLRPQQLVVLLLMKPTRLASELRAPPLRAPPLRAPQLRAPQLRAPLQSLTRPREQLQRLQRYPSARSALTRLPCQSQRLGCMQQQQPRSLRQKSPGRRLHPLQRDQAPPDVPLAPEGQVSSSAGHPHRQRHRQHILAHVATVAMELCRQR